MEDNIVQPVIDNIAQLAAQLGPSVATIGTVILGITATVALWTRFGPALVKKVFSKAS